MICAVVLAAGESRRMGSQKLLLPFGGETVVGHITDRLLESGLDGVYVIVGHQGDQVAEALAGRPVSVVTNRDYRAGMLSSIRCGLRRLPGECDAVMVALGDQPTITGELVDEMIRCFAATKKGILLPVYRGKRGHPLLFARHYAGEILTDYDDVGLRGLVQAHADDVFELSVSTPDVLDDVDYPEDYRRALKKRGQDR